MPRKELEDYDLLQSKMHLIEEFTNIEFEILAKIVFVSLYYL